MTKGIIFDLDGTLLDTSLDINKTVNDSLAKFSLAPITHKQTIEYVGNGAKKLIERAVGERTDLVDAVYADYIVRFANIDNNFTKPYPGEEFALNKFAQAGILMGIVTNKPQAATERVYGKFLEKFGFCIVLGQTEYCPLKPNPASTLAVIDKFKLKKEECVFVGDGETDVACARAAGIKCISALWGFRSREQLISGGAEHFAKDYAELVKIIL